MENKDNISSAETNSLAKELNIVPIISTFISALATVMFISYFVVTINQIFEREGILFDITSEFMIFSGAPFSIGLLLVYMVKTMRYKYIKEFEPDISWLKFLWLSNKLSIILIILILIMIGMTDRLQSFLSNI